MNMPAEAAFWCLVAICDKYIPGYYRSVKLSVLFRTNEKFLTSPAVTNVEERTNCK
jgi:hypothetical protein